MLSERIQIEELLKMKSEEFQIPIKISCNFIRESIAEKLLSGGFNPEEPSFYIFEGCSMYFSEQENLKILMEISGLLKQNPDSILWMDMIDSKVIKNTENLPKEVQS